MPSFLIRLCPVSHQEALLLGLYWLASIRKNGAAGLCSPSAASSSRQDTSHCPGLKNG